MTTRTIYVHVFRAVRSKQATVVLVIVPWRLSVEALASTAENGCDRYFEGFSNVSQQIRLKNIRGNMPHACQMSTTAVNRRTQQQRWYVTLGLVFGTGGSCGAKHTRIASARAQGFRCHRSVISRRNSREAAETQQNGALT